MRFRYLFALSAFLVISFQATATKIGFVDTRRILRESFPSRQSERKLRDEFADRLRYVKTLEAKISVLEVKMDTSNTQLSYADRHRLEREYNQLSSELRTSKRESAAALNERRSEEYQRIIGLANKAVRHIADLEKYDAILQEAVYVNKSVDITDKVLDFLQKMPDKVTVKTGVAKK